MDRTGRDGDDLSATEESSQGAREAGRGPGSPGARPPIAGRETRYFFRLSWGTTTTQLAEPELPDASSTSQTIE